MRSLFTSHRLNVQRAMPRKRIGVASDGTQVFRGRSRARNLTFRSSATARILRNYEAPRSNFSSASFLPILPCRFFALSLRITRDRSTSRRALDSAWGRGRRRVSFDDDRPVSWAKSVRRLEMMMATTRIRQVQFAALSCEIARHGARNVKNICELLKRNTNIHLAL